ncbi:hypothetical protein P3T24_004365 [Paraburkholderia sp. GAS33]|jgi:hypothetical protein|uniref:DUF1064 domain-containing protein n=1 Tax=Paraburkholderia sp. GAS33 TaxID=3035130 RepID=UPI003D261FA8
MKNLRLTEEEFARLKASHGSPGAHLRVEQSRGKGLMPPPMKLTATSPKERMQALGRLRAGAMNKTEEAYAAHLDAQRSLGLVLWFRFEGLKLRLADSTFYDTDFVVLAANGQLEIHEVKGFMTDDANVKLKVAASQYPFVFRLVRKAKGGNWDIREV